MPETTRAAPFRVEIREGDDGYTRALLALDGDTDRHELARVSSLPHLASSAVREAFIALSGALVQQVIADAFPGVSATVVTVAPGADLSTPKH